MDTLLDLFSVSGSGEMVGVLELRLLLALGVPLASRLSPRSSS